ncbi:hypothetical protein [Legionella pneumophila]|uniref:hypothetical protein n=1 Tax=Legionella pneumophila TaxID=446 RepID=UPI00277D0146|nr:hypothetical protein [Legionella pneumophila]
MNNLKEIQENRKVFFLLKEEQLVQQLIIKSLLKEHYMIEELAQIIGSPVATILSVQKGKSKFEQHTLNNLIHLFYQVNN